MVVKGRLSSEYQRSFKSKYPCFTKTYQTNFDYRLQRRSTEHNHEVDPFEWDSTSSSPSEGSSCLDVAQDNTPRVTTVPRHIHKHEKYNKAYRDRLNNLKEQLERSVQINDNKGELRVEELLTTQNEQTQTESPPVEVQDGAMSPDSLQLDLPPETEPHLTSKPALKQPSVTKKPRKPVISTGAPTHTVARPCRVKSAPKPRPASTPVINPELEARAPFVPYGFKDQEVRTGTQKTYNIRASADIHPSALLAQKRRQAAIHRREEEAKSAALKDKRKKALFNEFNERVKRDTAQWATEYRSRFAGYDEGVYKRSLSARPASRNHDAAFFGATCVVFTGTNENGPKQCY